MATPPPTKSAPSDPRDTPTHARMSSVRPFTSTAEEYDHVFVVAANEMAGKYFGPISTDEFLRYYLPESSEIPEMPEFHGESFASVAAQRLEVDMYNPMVSDHRM